MATRWVGLVVFLTGCTFGGDGPACDLECPENGACEDNGACVCETPTSCTLGGAWIHWTACCEPASDEDCLGAAACDVASGANCCVNALRSTRHPGGSWSYCGMCR